MKVQIKTNVPRRSPFNFPREHPKLWFKAYANPRDDQVKMCDGRAYHIPFALHRAARTHRGAAPEPLCAPSAQEPWKSSALSRVAV